MMIAKFLIASLHSILWFTSVKCRPCCNWQQPLPNP